MKESSESKIYIYCSNLCKIYILSGIGIKHIFSLYMMLYIQLETKNI